jgi:hypothetical protein
MKKKKCLHGDLICQISILRVFIISQNQNELGIIRAGMMSQKKLKTPLIGSVFQKRKKHHLRE